MDEQDNLILAGETDSSVDGHNHAGGMDTILMKFDSTGSWLWTAQKGGSGSDSFHAVKVCGVLICAKLRPLRFVWGVLIVKGCAA